MRHKHQNEQLTDYYSRTEKGHYLNQTGTITLMKNIHQPENSTGLYKI